MVPNCDCGIQFESRGGSFSPSMNVGHYVCPSCDRVATQVTRSGWTLFLVVAKQDTAMLSDYLNTVLAVQTRAYAHEVEPIREARELAQDMQIFGSFGIDVSNGCQYVPGAGLSGTFQDLYGKMLVSDEAEVERIRAALRKSVPVRAEDCVTPPHPVKKPPFVTAYVLRNGGWVKTEPGMSSDRPPEDPTLAKHLSYYNDVFDIVAGASGTSFIPKQTPNQYHADSSNCEPWFTFNVCGVPVTVGPRKRVTEIKVGTFVGCNTDLIASLATRDDVTFVRHDSYAVIHAWDRARLVEYLTVCLAYCRGNSPAI